MSKKNIAITSAIALTALFVGVGMGVSTQPEPRTETKIETKTVEKPFTPAACEDMAAYGDEAFEHIGTLATITSQGIQDAFEWNADALDAGTAEINKLSSLIGDTRANFDLAKAQCLAEQS